MGASWWGRERNRRSVGIGKETLGYVASLTSHGGREIVTAEFRDEVTKPDKVQAGVSSKRAMP
jgi:hypothetical protein